MVPQPLPVAQHGKKNAEPGKSLCVLWGEGEGGESRYRQSLDSQGLVILWHWW